MALPPKYRAAVYLYYYEDYSVQEIAGLMGAKTSTVQTWLMRARGQLRLKLKEAESL
jgi:RNA polymerase sigma-70 factor (ECF subfamily)